jgi:hypothetical protein
VDFTNFNVSFEVHEAGGQGNPTLFDVHPSVRIYFLPLSGKEWLAQLYSDQRLGKVAVGPPVFGVAETPDYFVVTSRSRGDLDFGQKTTYFREESRAPMGRALEKYFGKFYDEEAGAALGILSDASRWRATNCGFAGQVVDDRTGRPIKEFRIWIGSNDIPSEFKSGVLDFACFGGRFGLQFQDSDAGWHVVQLFQGGGSLLYGTPQWAAGQKVWPQIRADGYLTEPVTPEPVVWPVKLTNIVVRLKRAGASAPPPGLSQRLNATSSNVPAPANPQSAARLSSPKSIRNPQSPSSRMAGDAN